MYHLWRQQDINENKSVLNLIHFRKIDLTAPTLFFAIIPYQ